MVEDWLIKSESAGDPLPFPDDPYDPEVTGQVRRSRWPIVYTSSSVGNLDKTKSEIAGNELEQDVKTFEQWKQSASKKQLRRNKTKSNDSLPLWVTIESTDSYTQSSNETEFQKWQESVKKSKRSQHKSDSDKNLPVTNQLYEIVYTNPTIQTPFETNPFELTNAKPSWNSENLRQNRSDVSRNVPESRFSDVAQTVLSQHSARIVPEILTFDYLKPGDGIFKENVYFADAKEKQRSPIPGLDFEVLTDPRETKSFLKQQNGMESSRNSRLRRIVSRNETMDESYLKVDEQKAALYRAQAEKLANNRRISKQSPRKGVNVEPRKLSGITNLREIASFIPNLDHPVKGQGQTAVSSVAEQKQGHYIPSFKSQRSIVTTRSNEPSLTFHKEASPRRKNIFISDGVLLPDDFIPKDS